MKNNYFQIKLVGGKAEKNQSMSSVFPENFTLTR